jgi:hypothetical protein
MSINLQKIKDYCKSRSVNCTDCVFACEDYCNLQQSPYQWSIKMIENAYNSTLKEQNGT